MPSISKPASSERQASSRKLALSIAVLITVVLLAAGVWCNAVVPRAKTHHVVIVNMQFSPAELEISLGDRIEFRNQDIFPHTASAKTGQMFDSGVLQSGAVWSFTPGRAGVIGYQCVLHPTMEGRITIRTSSGQEKSLELCETGG